MEHLIPHKPTNTPEQSWTKTKFWTQGRIRTQYTSVTRTSPTCFPTKTFSQCQLVWSGRTGHGTGQRTDPENRVPPLTSAMGVLAEQQQAAADLQQLPSSSQHHHHHKFFWTIQVSQSATSTRVLPKLSWLTSSRFPLRSLMLAGREWFSSSAEPFPRFC